MWQGPVELPLDLWIAPGSYRLLLGDEMLELSIAPGATLDLVR